MPERLPQFAELQRLLRQAGIIDATTQRLLEELQDHFRDLRDAAIETGTDPLRACEMAQRSIGAPADIAAVAVQYRELLTLSQRYPYIAGLAHGIASAVCAPVLPVHYCAERRDSIARWGASVGLAGMITAALLLSLHSMLGAI
jgi:hypothetical protein